MKKVLVYLETRNGRLTSADREAMGAALQIPNAEVTAIVIGERAAADAASYYGFQRVLLAETDSDSVEIQAEVLVQTLREGGEDVLIIGSTPVGKELTARIAHRLDGVCLTNIMSLSCGDDSTVRTCVPIYGGTVIEHETCQSGVFLAATVRSGAFSKAERTSIACEVKTIPMTYPNKLYTQIVNVVNEVTENVDLESAEVIVAGGRGMGGPENFRLVEELAELLGGAVGASRPAVEENWIPRTRQIGQSGKVVAPKLYIACGISGAAQHVTAITGSKFIIAINKDEDAPIFKIADVGIVGDMSKVLPLMIQAIKDKRM